MRKGHGADDDEHFCGGINNTLCEADNFGLI